VCYVPKNELKFPLAEITPITSLSYLVMNSLRLKNLNAITDFHGKVNGDFTHCYELGFCLLSALGKDSEIDETRKFLTVDVVKEQADLQKCGDMWPIDKFLTYLDDQMDVDHTTWLKAIQLCLAKK
jgi:hypothetical protein